MVVQVILFSQFCKSNVAVWTSLSISENPLNFEIISFVGYIINLFMVLQDKYQYKYEPNSNITDNSGIAELDTEGSAALRRRVRLGLTFYLPLKHQSQLLSSALSSACDFKSHFCKQYAQIRLLL